MTVELRKYKLLALLILIPAAAITGTAAGEEDGQPKTATTAPAIPIRLSLAEDASQGANRRDARTVALWYLPNRILDLFDIFRLRLKAGPGLGATLRVTDYAAFYAGRQHTAYIGLPGPRYPEQWPAIVGLENQRGLVIAGVDATDALPHPPRYGFSEVNAGLHLGLIGAEAGADPFELADWLAGWFLLDLRSDDLPRAQPMQAPEREGVLSRDISSLTLDGVGKPDSFESLPQRLEYLRVAVPARLQEQVHLVDRRFANGNQPVLPPPPMEDLSLSVYVRSRVGDRSEVEFKPDINLDVELPNLERRIRLFVQSSSDDDLPGRDPIEREDKGWTVGTRQEVTQWDITTDAGVRVRWLPELYLRTAWKSRWEWGAFRWRFEQRVFWESEDGLGTLSSLRAHRWLTDRWVYQQVTSGRITEESEGFQWEQSFTLGHATRLFDESVRGRRHLSAKDAIEGYSIAASIFGSDDAATEYRALLGYRRALYDDFVIGGIRAGPEWRDVDDWDAGARIELGVTMVF